MTWGLKQELTGQSWAIVSKLDGPDCLPHPSPQVKEVEGKSIESKGVAVLALDPQYPTGCLKVSSSRRKLMSEEQDLPQEAWWPSPQMSEHTREPDLGEATHRSGSDCPPVEGGPLKFSLTGT